MRLLVVIAIGTLGIVMVGAGHGNPDALERCGYGLIGWACGVTPFMLWSRR